MSKDRHEQVGALFLQARELPPDDRAAFLAEACADDAALRAEVESLLEGEAAAPNLTGALRIPTGSQNHRNIKAQPSDPRETIETPAVSMAAERPDRVGPYKILEQIGEGGMGTVYVAEQTAPIRRRVALKIIKLGMDTRQVIARFEAERQALAMMDHPNIARALDAGATETGRPFFVMELVRGIPITDYCDQERLDTRSRLELFIHVCEAIQHAHHKGIVHRDIKPSNVMVTLQDGVPVPKVIDFGVAKATNAELTQKTLFTEHGQLIGTPEYMSPEQAEMSGLDIDTRSDIYSLGVLLYVLLTGTTPFSSRELHQGGFSKLQHIIREQEPRKPSTRLSELPSDPEAPADSRKSAAGEGSLHTTTIEQIARQRRVNPHTLRRQLRGDLDWVVLKALEKDRSRRYETANSLAADIKRHLNDEPVVASPPHAGYRLRKFIRRNRTGVFVAGLIAITLVVGIVGTTIGFVRANRASEVAAANAEQAEQVTEFLEEMFFGSMQQLVEVYHQQGKTEEAEALLTRSLEQYRRVLGEEHIDTIGAMDRLAALYGRLGRLDEAIALWAQALEIRKRVRGEGHADTLWNMNQLAQPYFESGRLEEAESILRASLALHEHALGKTHPMTVWTRLYLIKTLRAQGRVDEAASLTQVNLKPMLQAAQRPDADANTLNEAAWELLIIEPQSLRDPQAALGFAVRADELTGHQYPNYLDTLALAYQLTGDRPKAIEIWTRALELLPEGHKDRVEYADRLSECKRALEGETPPP